MAGTPLVPWFPLCDPGQDCPSRNYRRFWENTHQAGNAGANEQFANPREAGIFWLEGTKLWKSVLGDS